MAKVTVRISCDMPPTLCDKLDLAAHNMRKSRANLIREIITAWVELAEGKTDDQA
jgi:metal-responsive CopG/Arc/MetJ family transcriptional regulator